MRVVQRHADGLTLILERNYLLDARHCRQRSHAVGPRFGHRARPTLTQRAERFSSRATP